MQVGFLGTGRMGKAMAANLLKAGHRVRAWDKSPAALGELKAAGAEIARRCGGNSVRRCADLHVAERPGAA